MRFKVLDNTLFFDQNKKRIQSIENLTYGSFIIHLHGLWLLNDKAKIWMDYTSKVKLICLFIYQVMTFIDDDNKGKGKGKFDSTTSTFTK